MAKIEIDEETQKDLKACFNYLDVARDYGGSNCIESVENHIFTRVRCLLGCKFILPRMPDDDKKG